MSYIIPALLKKNITFRRLPNKACLRYEIYGSFVDNTYASGIRTELLEVFDNPVEPSPEIKRITLEQVEDPTWVLPDEAYLDRDHRFRLFQNGFVIPSMAYTFNRITRKITLDNTMKKYNCNDVMELEYYRDIITRSYALLENCTITVKPIFSQSYAYGDHNVII